MTRFARVQKSRRLETDIVNNDINERVQALRCHVRLSSRPESHRYSARARMTRVYYSLTCQLTSVSRCPVSLPPSPIPDHRLINFVHKRVVASANGVVAQMYTFHNLIASWCHLRAIDHPRPRVARVENLSPPRF